MTLEAAAERAVAIRVQPRSSSDAVAGERQGAIVIRLKAPPVDGEANGALLRFIASKLGVRQRDVTLVRGSTSRHKWIEVASMGAEQARQALLN
ncbi:MAG: DUF167 domain-containing protein [Cyanobacteria bacterium]|nr:DUF167 domain-containing protein [Cyanobacteriota bacterium]